MLLFSVATSSCKNVKCVHVLSIKYSSAVLIATATTCLNSVFRKIGFQRQHFALVDVRVVRVLERLFQLFQLVAREYCPTRTTEILVSHSSKKIYLLVLYI